MISRPLVLATVAYTLIACADDPVHHAEVAAATQALSTGTTTIPTTGQSFSIAIASPAQDATLPLGPVTVHGSVSIGNVVGTPVNVLGIVDVSGSTGTGAGMDCNGDGNSDALDDINHDLQNGDILDCELAGMIALNAGLTGTVSVDVGLAVFGLSAVVADIQPQAGLQSFTMPTDADLDSDGVPDFEQVAESVRVGLLTLFSSSSVGQFTNYDAAITAMNQAFAGQPAGEQNLAFFLSDGMPQCGGACPNAYSGVAGPLGQAVAAGTTIHTFAVGMATGCAGSQPLAEMAQLTNGTCTEVADPSQLSASLPQLVPSGLDRVEVNGTTVTTDVLGNFTTALSCTSGATLHIAATAYASDADATTVSADVSVHCCTDSDNDGSCDADDPCPNDPQDDVDLDGICGDVDNCPSQPNPDQSDADGDGAGDACDVCPLDAADDADGDGICADVDNCSSLANPDQADADADGLGDACDACPNDAANDEDGDGICAELDNCPALANADQVDSDGDGLGDACDVCPNDSGDDADADGVCASQDLCENTVIPEAAPTEQLGANRFALVDADTVFDTLPPTGRGPQRTYTVADTLGCSCQQIVAALGLGDGQLKHGCSIGVMDGWVSGRTRP